jgi:hypothetical protein
VNAVAAATVEAARLIAYYTAILTGTAPHDGHSRRQVGNVVLCDCGARAVGQMTNPEPTEGQNP